MRVFLVVCAILLVMGCTRTTYYEEAYRAGAIDYHMWQSLEQQDRDVGSGKYKYGYGSQGEIDLLDRMLAEPVRVRIR